jgi:hypothetical protein
MPPAERLKTSDRNSTFSILRSLSKSLEPQPQCELPIAPLSGARNPPEVAGKRIRIRIVKIRMVPCVKHLGAELESATRRNLEVLDGGEVPSDTTITANPAETQRLRPKIKA